MSERSLMSRLPAHGHRARLAAGPATAAASVVATAAAGPTVLGGGRGDGRGGGRLTPRRRAAGVVAGAAGDERRGHREHAEGREHPTHLSSPPRVTGIR